MIRGVDKQLYLGRKLSSLMPGGNRSYTSLVLADAPLAFWKCQDASGNPADASGNNHPMTTVTTVGGGAATYQSAGPFTSDYSIDSNGVAFSQTCFLTSVNNFAVEMWVFPMTVSASNLFFGNCNRGVTGGGASTGWDVVSDVTTPFLKYEADSPNVLTYAASTNPLVLNAWNHLIVTRESGAWKYYLNGVANGLPTGAGAPVTPSGSTFFGEAIASWRAKYAYVALYNTALTATQAATHFTATVA